MKKTALFILLSLPFCYSFGSSLSSSIPGKDPLASELMIPLFSTGQFISVEDFIKLTPKSYRQIAGKKMSLKEKIGLVFGKRSLKKMINKDGTVNTAKMKRGGMWGGFQWHWGGFALGFFLNILGPIVALFFNDDYKWDRFWTALHTAVYVWLILVIIVAAAGGGVY